MKDNLNIEELFKQKFDGFEGNVDSSAWSNIQQGMNSAGAGGGIVGSGLSGLAKVAIVAGLVTSTAVSVWYFSGDSDETTNDLSELVQNEVVEDTSGEPLQTLGENIIVTDTNDPVIQNNIEEIQGELSEFVLSPQDIDLIVEILGEEISIDPIDDIVVENDSNIESNKDNQPNVVVKDFVEESVRIKCNLKFEVDNNNVEFVSNAQNHSEVKWSFGDGSTETGEEVSHEYARPGEYEVSMMITNEKNKTKVVKTDVVIKGTSRIGEVANVITPSDNDGRNDYFFIESEGIETFYISITNAANGKEVFTSNDVDFEWNGQNMNGVVELGNYVYTIIAEGEDGRRYTNRIGALVVR